VDQVQVNLVDAESSQALPGLGGGVVAPWVELGRDEYLVAGQAAVAQRFSDALLVAVGLSRVDMAVPRSSAQRTASTVAGPLGTCQTPRPSIGI
jgi:hypothetical protein